MRLLINRMRLTSTRQRWLIATLVVSVVSVVTLGVVTRGQIREFPVLATVSADANMPQLLDRHGKLLATQVQRGWNQNDQVPLHQIPARLQQAFVLAEDKRFFIHAGVDWQARMNALWQTLSAGETVRGASTITEQVVRMVHPRARNLWSKWLETFEAYRLEKAQAKGEILDFYFNQLPYGAERRGVVQAARYYFGRDLDTLSDKEMLALAVLARAPGLLAKPQHTARLEARIQQLAQRMHEQQALNDDELQRLLAAPLQLTLRPAVSNAFHFARYVWSQSPADHSRIQTTLDGDLQAHVTELLNARLQQLADRNVQNGAVLVADHQTHEILVWAVSGDIANNTPGAFIDAVRTPRQPGSSLKPFVYAMALEKGWTPATWLEDAPLETAVGNGLHSFRNFSRVFYGDIRLREALANSLNIPAVKTLDFVGIQPAIDTFKRLGFEDLSRNPAIYGEGLVLGNGEVTLFELVQAYSVLADRGRFQPLRVDMLADATTQPHSQAVFSPETSSLISNILADANARRLEFGSASSLSFPVETAAKTGTSTDHRDAWLVAYNHRYVVGLWMGNLTQEPMRDITGSTGPALLAHGIFAELNRREETRPLYLSPNLVKHPVCIERVDTPDCKQRDEWFTSHTSHVLPNSLTDSSAVPHDAVTPQAGIVLEKPFKPIMLKPTDGLRMAMDPRVPDALEAFEFALSTPTFGAAAGNDPAVNKVDWYLDGGRVATTQSSRWLWPLARGKHVLYAEVFDLQGTSVFSDAVAFTVK